MTAKYIFIGESAPWRVTFYKVRHFLRVTNNICTSKTCRQTGAMFPIYRPDGQTNFHFRHHPVDKSLINSSFECPLGPHSSFQSLIEKRACVRSRLQRIGTYFLQSEDTLSTPLWLCLHSASVSVSHAYRKRKSATKTIRRNANDECLPRHKIILGLEQSSKQKKTFKNSVLRAWNHQSCSHERSNRRSSGDRLLMDELRKPNLRLVLRALCCRKRFYCYFSNCYIAPPFSFLYLFFFFGKRQTRGRHDVVFVEDCARGRARGAPIQIIGFWKFLPPWVGRVSGASLRRGLQFYRASDSFILDVTSSAKGPHFVSALK